MGVFKRWQMLVVGAVVLLYLIQCKPAGEKTKYVTETEPVEDYQMLNPVLQGDTLLSFKAYDAELMPNGNTLLAIDFVSNLYALNFKGKQLWMYPNVGDVQGLACSNNGQTIVMNSLDVGTTVLDDKGGKKALLHKSTGFDDKVFEVYGAPNDKHLLLAKGNGFTYNGFILVDSIGNKLFEFDRKMGFKGALKTISFSPNSEQIMAVFNDTIAVWNLKGEVLHYVFHENEKIEQAMFAPNGLEVLAVCDSFVVRLWNLAGEEMAEMKHDTTVWQLQYAKNAAFIGAFADSIGYLWTNDGQLVQKLVHQKPIRALCFSPDSQHVLTASDDKTAKIWNTKGQLKATLVHPRWVNQEAKFSPNGLQVLTLSGSSKGYDKGLARLWDLHGNLLNELETNAWIRKANFTPDGKALLLLSVSHNGLLWQWDKTPN